MFYPFWKWSVGVSSRTKFALAVSVSVVISLFRIALNPYFDTNLIYVFYIPGIFFIALFAGVLPAWVGIFISSAMTITWILPPLWLPYSVNHVDALGLVLYMTIGGVFAWIGGQYRQHLIESEHQRERITSDFEGMKRLEEIGAICVRSGNELTQCLDEILQASIALTHADKGNIQLFDAESATLKIAFQRGFDEPFVKFFEHVRDNTSACGAAMQSKQRITVEDVRRSDIFVGQPSLNVLLDAGVRALQSTPLISSTGEVLGIISTHFGQPTHFGERELRFMDLLAREAADYLERKQIEAALYAREMTLRAVTETTPLMLTRCSRDLRYLYVNHAYAAMLGSTPEQISGKPIVEIMGEKGFEIIRPRVEQVLDGQPVGYEDRVYFKLTGRLHYLHVTYTPDRDKGGNVIGWIASIEDVTDRKRAEDALREADRRKNEFLAVLGHELRNPLGIISTVVQLMKKRAAENDGMEELRETAERQVSQMARLLDDLLDVSRIAHGQIRLQKERCNLTAIVEQAIEDYRPILQESNLEPFAQIANVPLWVEGDRARLLQIVGNALTNACKFTDSGGKVMVRLMKAQDRGEAVLSVRDTGIGMALEMLMQAFEPFVQNQKTLDRARGGLGLGLALLKGLVELHGGKVAIASDGPGTGVEVTIRLPLIEAVSEPAEPPDPIQQSTRSYRILLIEDNLVAAKSIQMFLRQIGHTVEVAHTGQAGIEAARASKPEVVLCDLGLPDLDGYQVASMLRQQPELKQSLLLAITGYGQEEDKRRATQAGFDVHLTKPIDFQQLESLLTGLGTHEPTFTVKL